MSDVESFYGGSIMAMAGNGCVSIISDYRLGNGPITTSKNFRRVFMITDRIALGLCYFVPDAQFLLKKVEKHVSLFRLTEGREIEPKECANLVSAILYSHRESPLYTSPVIAGIDSENNTYVCDMDSLGCKKEPGNFVAEGSAASNLQGLCESLHRENMDEEELFTVSAQAFLNAIDRDALSGWGAECILISPKRRIVRSVKGRCD